MNPPNNKQRNLGFAKNFQCKHSFPLKEKGFESLLPGGATDHGLTVGDHPPVGCFVALCSAQDCFVAERKDFCDGFDIEKAFFCEGIEAWPEGMFMCIGERLPSDPRFGRIIDVIAQEDSEGCIVVEGFEIE